MKHIDLKVNLNGMEMRIIIETKLKERNAIFVHPENICNFTPEMYTKRSLIKISNWKKSKHTKL